MPVIEGEKWACSSCIKGHRVSGCNHNDRELHHINPKGRPVKQCEHCRGARKSKSHHAKCDCGDKKDKDKLKDKGDAKAHDNRCQCHSGGKCMCGTAKDVLDVKLETGRQTLHDARTKPKLMTTHSESHLTVFANGHHKPCHRNNNTAHVSGAPYKIPRPHTLHGHAAFASLGQNNANYSKPEVNTSRSMDTLSLSNTDYYAMFGSNQRTADALPTTTIPENVETSPFQESLYSAQSGMFTQGDSSPSSNSDTIDALSAQWPWATTAATPVNATFAYASLSTSPSQECLPNLENDWSIPSAGFNPLWSAGDLPLDPSKFSDSLAQPISHSGESKQSGPGLTAASSVHSEVGEPNLFGDVDFKAPQSNASESLFWEDSPVYGLNPTTTNESIMAPSNASTAALMSNVQSLEPTFAKSMGSVPNVMGTTASNGFPESAMAAIAMPTAFEDNVPVDPWTVDASTASFAAMNGFDMPYNNWF